MQKWAVSSVKSKETSPAFTGQLMLCVSATVSAMYYTVCTLLNYEYKLLGEQIK